MIDIDVSSFINEAKRLKAEYDKLLNEKGQSALKGFFKNVFETCPDLIAIHWTQYTPYFNDGEPCEFGVGEPQFKLTSTDEDEESDWGFKGYQNDLMTKVYCDGPAKGKTYGHDVNSVYAEIDYTNPQRVQKPNPYYNANNRYAGQQYTTVTEYLPTGKFYTYQYSNPEYENVEKAVNEFFNNIPDEVFEAAFGDHATITATRDGFEVDEYSHD